MDEQHLSLVFSKIERLCQLTPGLSDSEVKDVEAEYAFVFPPDLRAFLQYKLPVSDRFPDWRNGESAKIKQWLDLPLDGIRFDVGNGLWPDTWGIRPSNISDALESATEMVRHAPRLIPVYGHRFLPPEPCLAGNPVFSVHQLDIIYYGYDLSTYFHIEFGVALPASFRNEPRPIDFWTDIPIWNGHAKDGAWWFWDRRTGRPAAP
jgi:hypothetical protein